MESLNGRSIGCNRVLIVDNQPLMGAGLERLLAAEEQLQVIGVTFRSEEQLVQDIWRATPDILILTVEPRPISPYQLWQQLAGYGRLCIIQISLYSNTVQIFDMQQLTIHDQNHANDDEDLMASIHSFLTAEIKAAQRRPVGPKVV